MRALALHAGPLGPHIAASARTHHAAPVEPRGEAGRSGPLASGLRRLEGRLDQWFGAAANPLRHLGALGFLMFWIVAASGVYLYAFFDTSVTGAYHSVEQLTHGRPWGGGLARSLHRYASDGLVLLILLHLGRELLYGRYHGFRWFTWVTGVPLLWLALAAGVVGFWLVWDQLAQFSAIATMEWLEWLRVFGRTLTRTFLTPASVDDRLFSLFVFLHIGLPLLLLLGMWVHIQRLSRPDTRTAAPLTWGTLVALLALSIAVPVVSEPAADLARTPVQVPLDWFYLAPHAFQYWTSAGMLWLVAGGFTLLLFLCPLLPHPARAPVAVVDASNCNGCRRCFADCPYGAIRMQPHPDRRIGMQLAVVEPSLCAACGICAGSCPSSTPFRSIARVVSGIDMPQLPVDGLRAELRAQLARLHGTTVIVAGCDHGADVRALAADDTAAISLICTGQLPPAFIEYALRIGADGVLVVACPDGGCEFRLGSRWTAERLNGLREPHLRPSVAPQRWRLVTAAPHELAGLRAQLDEFRAGLAAAAGSTPAVDAHA